MLLKCLNTNCIIVGSCSTQGETRNIYKNMIYKFQEKITSNRQTDMNRWRYQYKEFYRDGP